MKTHYFQKKTLSKPSRPHRPAVVPHALSIASDPRADIRRILRGSRLQAKLTIGAPDDVYEREADRVADAVMRMPDSQTQAAEACEAAACPRVEEATLQAKTLSDRINPLVQRQNEEDEAEELLQTKEVAGHTPEVTFRAAAEIASMQGGGQPLPPSERAFFEPRFGKDFSHVRIHTGAGAAESAKAVNAQAFTTGQHVIFGLGEYRPGSASGRKLLAHELTHVVQQTASKRRNPEAIGALLQRSGGGSVENSRPSGGRTIILFAGGFNPFASDAEEAAYLHGSDSKYWIPGTKDFKRTATDTQASDIHKIETVNHFFGPLREEKGSIGRIVYIGHGASGALGFSSSGDILNNDKLSLWEATIDQAIRPKLSKSATIDLYSCEAGREEGIMNTLAAAFGVCVKGFPEDLKWCIHSPKDSDLITSRGRWLEGGIGAADPACESPEWNKGVSSVLPPIKVCPK